ncbi:hypothetical protein [Halobellus captivus]|uniref:hypothetical protein n=1 Tax=Halobellus captivus TaxID=2592614 RepID=UPI0011A4F2F2|nr:hypothetical protein [Halobellus captivus]
MSSSEWIPVNELIGEEIKSGQKATFTFEPDASGMQVDVIAASKYKGLTYEVEVDGDVRFGPAPAPPTDIDDLSTTHNPRMPVNRRLVITVRNPSANDRFVFAQVRGVEQ